MCVARTEESDYNIQRPLESFSYFPWNTSKAIMGEFPRKNNFQEKELNQEELDQA